MSEPSQEGALAMERASSSPVASAHTEVYRPYEGELKRGGFNAWPIASAGIRVASRGKIALLILYLPMTIAAIVMSFMVYVKYSALTGQGDARAQMMGTLLQGAIQVREEIALMLLEMQNFSVLAIAWYGAGLLCEDHKNGAHYLLFSRPLSRLQYLLGKGLVVWFYGALAVIAPSLIICFVATLSSPDYIFLKEESEVIWGALAYGGLTVFVLSAVVLACSCLADRKIFALAASFAFFFGTFAVSNILASLREEPRFRFLDVNHGLEQVGLRLLQIDVGESAVPLSSAWTCIGAVLLVCGAILAWRLKRLEVVA